MKQTAVEYLYSIMFEKKGRISKEEFNQAKEMEKEQIYNAYVHGQNNGYMYRDGQAPIINTDIYYNETFKS